MQGSIQVADLMTYGEAAAELRLSVSRIRQLVAAKELPPVEISPGRRFVTREAVAALSEARRKELETRLHDLTRSS